MHKTLTENKKAGGVHPQEYALCVFSPKVGFMRAYSFLLIGILFLLHHGAVAQQTHWPPDSLEIFVVKLGWHTAFVFPTDEISSRDWPEIERYRKYHYVYIGWGDEAFYLSTDDMLLITIRAVMIPTPAVIRVVGFYSPPATYFGPKRKLISLRLSRVQFSNLLRNIAGNFKRDEAGNVISSKEYGHTEEFFLSRNSYFFGRTCNTWIAFRLKHAGIPYTCHFNHTAGRIMRKLSQLKVAGMYYSKGKP
ncbi:MAG: DUF2459 domain-containing protein [Bacteroidetes bacterium]|nr:DUF2459 domain-containing protein [Bacteroidota bacterium]